MTVVTDEPITVGDLTPKVVEGMVNAGHEDFTGPYDVGTRSGRASAIQDAIDFAENKSPELPFVLVPDSLGPGVSGYDGSAVNFSGSGGTWTGRMIREGQLADVYDVKAYGAAGDGDGAGGGTDDSAALEAVAQAANGRGALFIPEGQYRFTSGRDWTALDLSIVGEGVRRSILEFDGDGGGALLLAQESNVFRDFAVEAVAGTHTFGIGNDPDTSGGMQNTLWENVRVEGFDGDGWLLLDVWQHTFVRCDALFCDTGWRLGDRTPTPNQSANDITLHSCNSRQHDTDGLFVDSSLGAVTVLGGNYANCGRDGIRVNTTGVSIYGTYHEFNGGWDIYVRNLGTGCQVLPGTCAEGDHNIRIDGADCIVGGGTLDGNMEGIRLGGGGETAARVVILPFRWTGSGTKIVRGSIDRVFEFHDEFRLDSHINIGFFEASPVGQQPALTAQDGATVNGTYGTEEQGVIQNNRTRIAELETALQNFGFIS